MLSALKLAPPIMFAGTDSILHFLNVVRPPSFFSQAPVRTEDESIGLVTTNAVARWIAEAWEPSQGAVLGDADISEVLCSSEVGDRVEIRDRNLRVVDAWRLFAGEAGEPPAAILLTQTGSQAQRPLGL
jgi:predicted transcriptional regulator